MGEAEDVVDEEQHVLALVAEILGNGQTGQTDTGAGARGLVHLAVDQRALGAFDRALVRVLVHAGLDHLVIEIVALARALADAGKHRITAMRLGHVVDELHDQHGLADAGTAEQPDLAALGVRREQVHHLDAGNQNRRFGRLIGVGRRVLMDGALGVAFDRAGLIDRIANHVDDAPEEAGTDRHRNRRAGVADFLAADQTFAGVHRHGAHGVLAELLGDFEH